MASQKKLLTYPLWLYILLFIFFVYVFVQILHFQLGGSQNALVTAPLYFVEFGVHEASHLAVFFLPPIAVAMAGSIGEILFTILVIIATIRTKVYFASVFAGLWLMLSLRSVGQYIADARSQLIPLAGPGDNVTHDWNFILGHLSALQNDTILGNTLIAVALFVGICSLGLGLGLIVTKCVLLIKSHHNA